jgi:hypothetical protein
VKRRRFLKVAGSVTLLPLLGSEVPAAFAAAPVRRVRPSDPAWPGPALWEELNQQVGGGNSYFIGEQPAGTQTSGWVKPGTPPGKAPVPDAKPAVPEGKPKA